LRQGQARFEGAGAQIVVIGMGDPAETVTFKKEIGLKFPMLSDTGAKSYTAAKMGQLQAKEELKPRNVGAFFTEIFKGNRGGKIVGKVRQLGGAVVVDKNGLVHFSYRSRSMSDNADVKVLFEAVNGLKG
jgi:peroxiredoxin